jgi:exodeoxyribonuclease V alpha subunit
VVTGGPGTGKTLVAAAIVRGFAALGVANVALAAQTGKAANRLTEVIAEQLGAVGAVGPAPVAQTLHRLLGYRTNGFAHHAQSPLPVGAVIVDEASMLDLELIDALLDALPATAPLVLIGDANQLPAIDAGRVLADLTAGGPTTAPSVAVLAQSFRQDTADPDGRAVFEAARAIHDGDPARFLKIATARTPNRLIFGGVEWIDTAGPRSSAEGRSGGSIDRSGSAAPRSSAEGRSGGSIDRSGPAAPRSSAEGRSGGSIDVLHQVAEATWHHFGGPQALRTAERVFRFVDGAVAPEQRAELEALWQLLGRARILTVTRALPTGSVAINHHLHQLGLDRLSVTGAPDFIPGEPVMITANDYHRSLFNGDQGMIVRADEGLGRHHYRAVFRTGGELRLFAIEALRDHLELAWALTIHKSQGSELDAIALLMPHEDLPLVTRELLYTGVTRARRSVVLAGARALLAAGVKRVALRESGLAERLAALRTA